MGSYALRLAKRGIPTVLAMNARLVTKDLEIAAVKVGMPVEFLSDALRLSIELLSSEPAHNKKARQLT